MPDFSRAINGIKVVTRWIEREPCVASLEPGRGTDAKEAFASEKGADIVFTDVELRYPTRPKKAAIRELNLRIPAGQTVAFCGTSGSGKSTVLSILQRFYEPSRGTITIGGVDIRSIPLANYRAQMAYVSQSSALFPGTARENLLLGCPEPEKITQEQIEAACEQACILDFVRSLPDGLDTDLGLTGSQMSGGQKQVGIRSILVTYPHPVSTHDIALWLAHPSFQRLCIARALLRDPEILLLDEATSALDAESEASVQRALDNASEGRTTITVAHRLSTIRKASRIFVVEDGQVIGEFFLEIHGITKNIDSALSVAHPYFRVLVHPFQNPARTKNSSKQKDVTLSWSRLNCSRKPSNHLVNFTSPFLSPLTSSSPIPAQSVILATTALSSHHILSHRVASEQYL